MGKLPIYFGYAGAIPFILFMLFTFAIDEVEHYEVLSFVQIGYGGMILSFLGGIHWGQAIPSNNPKQLSFAMIPTIACLILMVWTFLIDPVLPLLAMAGLFWIVYIADQKLMPLDFIPEGYFKFRKNLTMIVSATLIVSALVTM
ncbi:MAG: DUF3429 domain-containing protein [Bdellovibrionales bacterium]